MMKHKKGVELAFSQIIIIILVLAMIIWTIFWYSGMRDSIAGMLSRLLK